MVKIYQFLQLTAKFFGGFTANIETLFDKRSLMILTG